ncbi:MAG: 50S ribosomal protein L21 [Bryobacteraceae bacterium]|jgi:large subunit ribosomal protein L21
MYAVIETGGKQYRVAPGDTLQVEKLAGEAGAALEFGTVLAVGTDSGELLTGAAAATAKVTASIAKQGRGDKELVFKFKRKKQYKKTIGHRQYLTTIKIEEILA